MPDPFFPNGLEPLEQGASDSSTGTLKTEPKPLGENGSGTLAGQNADFGGLRAQAGSNGTESDRLIEQPDPYASVITGGVRWSEIMTRIAEANAALVPPDTKMFDDYTQEAVIGPRQPGGSDARDARDDRDDAGGDATQPRARRRSKKPAKKSTKKGGRK